MQGRYNIFFCWNPNSQLWSLNRTHPLTCCNLRPRKPLLQLQIEGATKPEIESILQVAQSRQQSFYLLHHITLPLEQQFENSVQVEHSTQLCSTLDTSPKQHHYRQGCSLAGVAMIVWIPTWLPTNQVFLWADLRLAKITVLHQNCGFRRQENLGFSAISWLFVHRRLSQTSLFWSTIFLCDLTKKKIASLCIPIWFAF